MTNPGVAVTLNSNNAVTNEGEIGFTDVSGATGILAKGGNTASVINTGSIVITETYTPTQDTNNDGLLTGPFAMGTSRLAIQVIGPGTLNGSVTNEGAITVHGNNSFGVDIETPITGNYQSLSLITPATATTAGVTSVGSINILGDNSVGLMISPTGGVGGSVQLTGINVAGVGPLSRGAVIDGPVGFVSGGGIDVSGLVTSTGYRTTARSNNPSISALYTAQELSLGGTALTVGGPVAGGLLISAPPLLLSTTNLAQDNDNNGIPDNIQTTGQVVSYGSAPALQIGDHGLNASLGLVVSPTPSNPIPGTVGYGFVIQGAVLGNGLFDQVTSPNLPAPVSATAIQIGTVNAAGAPDSTVFIAGGIHNTGGVTAQSYQADATAIHFLAGTATPTIVNDGSITASSQQVSTATSGIPQVNVNAILIEKGASVGAIVNSGAIIGNVTGTGGVGGVVGAIIDRSGTLTSITNTGSINAELTQTLITALVPGTVTAIDASASTLPQSLTQNASPNAGAAAFNVTVSYTAGAIVSENGLVYEALTASGVGVDPSTTPTIWRQIGATEPTINGSVLFGSGGATINLNAGTITGTTIALGSGVNTVNINGDANTALTGALLDGGVHTLTLNVNSGLLSDTNPNTILAKSVNVGASGVLLVSADPANHTNTDFIVSSASTFAPGAQVGLTLQSLPTSLQSQTFTIVQTAPGQGGLLSVGAFGSGAAEIAPYLFNVTPAFTAAAGPGQASAITITASLKTQSQLAFTNAEYSALPAILAALPANRSIQTAVLGQTSQAALRSVYDQLLPPQGQGLFDALDKATQAIGGMISTTPDAGTRVAGSSLWLQEVNERVSRSGLETQGSESKLLGIIAGYERMGPLGGAAGLTLAYFNAEEAEAAQQIGGNVIASMVEAGAYYRRSVGALTFAARGAGGYAFFNGERRLVAPGATQTATSAWDGYFFDGHVQVAYEQKVFGRYYARPELSADYLRLRENGHQESGGGDGFDLNVDGRTSTRFSGQAVIVLGAQWGKAQWLRSELRGGIREVFSGNVGDTVASFAGGDPFSLSPDSDKGGWATFGFSLKGGSQYSYFALEGDADFRSGEQRYDVRLAGRSIF